MIKNLIIAVTITVLYSCSKENTNDNTLLSEETNINIQEEIMSEEDEILAMIDNEGNEENDDDIIDEKYWGFILSEYNLMGNRAKRKNGRMYYWFRPFK